MTEARSHRFPVKFRGGILEFVVLKHFAWEFLHVKPFCGLDVLAYMLKCVFC